VKLDGARSDLEAICGKKSVDCKPIKGKLTYTSIEKGKERLIDVINDVHHDDRIKNMHAPLGSIQGLKGEIIGFEYNSGSFADKLVESYAEPHDFLWGQWLG
jgi:filamentous hemagglutinin